MILRLKPKDLHYMKHFKTFYENEVIDVYNTAAHDLVIARTRKEKHNPLKAMTSLQSKKDTTLYEEFNKLAIETDRKKRRTRGVDFTWPNHYKVHATMPENYDDLMKSYVAAEKTKDEAIKSKQMR